jgi:hypothetical protein
LQFIRAPKALSDGAAFLTANMTVWGNGKAPNLVHGRGKTIGDPFSLTVNSQESAVVREILACP